MNEKEKKAFSDWFVHEALMGETTFSYEHENKSTWSFFKREVGEGCVIYKREEDAYNTSRDLSDINGFTPFALISWRHGIYFYDDSFCRPRTFSFDKTYEVTCGLLWGVEVPEAYEKLDILPERIDKKLCKMEAREIVRAIQLGLKDAYDAVDHSIFTRGDFEATLLKKGKANDIIFEKLKADRRWDFKIEVSRKVKELLTGPELVTDYEKELVQIFRSHELVKVYLTLDNGREELVQPDVSYFFLNELVAEEPLMWTLDRKKEFGFESISRIVDKTTGECLYSAVQKETEEEREER